MLLIAGALPAAAADFSIDVRDADGRPVVDAVVYAEPAEGAVPAVKPHLRALVDQVDKEFVPRVSIAQAGTEIFFPNSDNIRHSIYSFSPAKTFTTKLYSGREAPPVTFDKTGIVVLGCNIHDAMVAWVVIVDTPWFAKSGTDGTSMLEDLPPGKYRVTAVAPATSLKPLTTELTLDATGAARHTFTLAGP